MKKVKNSEELLSYIREGREMTQWEKLKLIVQLSVPSILSQLSAVLMFFIDASMVGQLGARQAASVGLVETTTWLTTGLLTAASMGFSVQVAHAIGANDFERARRIMRQGIVCVAIFSLVLLLISVAIHSHLPFWLGGGDDIAHDASMYFLIFGIALPFFQYQSFSASMLKCSGDMQTPSIISVAVCVLDVLFNYIFIFVFGLGVTGAAIGTLTAIAICSVVMTYSLVGRSRHLSLRGRINEGWSSGEIEFSSRLDKFRQSLSAFRPTGDVVLTAWKIGAPMGLQQLLMGSAYITSTVIVAPLGNIAIAANTFAITVESLCYMPGYGIADAATTLIGQSLGAGQRLLTRSFARLTVAVGVVSMSLLAVLMFVFSYDLMSIMTPVEAIRTLGSDALRIEAFAEPFFAAAIVSYGVFVGAGDTLKPALMNLVSMWGIRLTLAAILATDYGLRGVWFAMAIELTFRGIIFIIRLLHGGWMDKTVGEVKATKRKPFNSA